MKKLRFVGRIASMGDKRIIIIPKDLHDELPDSFQVEVEIVEYK